MPAMTTDQWCRRPIAPHLTRTAILAGASAAALVMGGAGPIDPPPGPVAPTYRTLTEVEPRTPISQPAAPASADAMIVIDQPGSYYLTGNIFAPDRTAIQILSSDVTLDLNGFALIGANFATAAGVRGAQTFIENVAVVNGSIANFSSPAIEMAADNARFEGLRVRDCGLGILNSGAYAGVCRGNTFVDVNDRAISMGAAALVADNQLRYSTAATGAGPAVLAGDSSRIEGNTIENAPGRAIQGSAASLIQGNSIVGPGGDGIAAGLHARVVNNAVRSAGRVTAGSAGVRLLSPLGATVEDNSISSCPVGVISAGGAIIVRNRLLDNPTALQTGASDLVGPTVTPGTIAGGSNSLANLVN